MPWFIRSTVPTNIIHLQRDLFLCPVKISRAHCFVISFVPLCKQSAVLWVPLSPLPTSIPTPTPSTVFSFFSKAGADWDWEQARCACGVFCQDQDSAFLGWGWEGWRAQQGQLLRPPGFPLPPQGREVPCEQASEQQVGSQLCSSPLGHLPTKPARGNWQGGPTCPSTRPSPAGLAPCTSNAKAGPGNQNPQQGWLLSFSKLTMEPCFVWNSYQCHRWLLLCHKLSFLQPASSTLWSGMLSHQLGGGGYAEKEGERLVNVGVKRSWNANNNSSSSDTLLCRAQMYIKSKHSDQFQFATSQRHSV